MFMIYIHISIILLIITIILHILPFYNKESDREYWIKSMKKIINPIITSLCFNYSNYLQNFENIKSPTSPFEAFARVFDGISLWLNLTNITTKDELEYNNFIKKCIIVCLNNFFSSSKESVKFNSNIQYVVEGAFLSQALFRSFNVIWIELHEITKANIITQLKLVRKYKISQSNWILFSSMIELFLFKVENTSDISLIKKNYYTYMNWYKGDGWYGDGRYFHFDYYNSFVIQPFLLEISFNIEKFKLFKIDKNLIIKRFKRYVVCLERLINRDGTYPIIGRSITYRFGAFNPLALSVYYNIIPASLSPGKIKRGLTLVLKNFMKYPIFKKDGILKIGFTSVKQKNLGEDYISEGSTYLCTFLFSVLGIEENNSLWKEEELTTSEKVWKMEEIEIDESID